MLNQYVAQWKSRLQAKKASTVDGADSRRVGHGGTAWSVPLGVDDLHQPQDGAQGSEPVISRQGVGPQVLEIGKPTHRAHPLEPEDARLTGGTRSLGRRLMGLNVMAQAASILPSQTKTASALKRLASPQKPFQQVA